MIDVLTDEARLVIRARLEPVVGSTFQPTGFPDLGPAEFERPGSEDGAGRALLVDSVQALANHLEAVGWDGPAQRPVQELEGLPYVEVRDTQGRFLTSSRLEPHRLAGAYIRAATIDGTSAGDWLIERQASRRAFQPTGDRSTPPSSRSTPCASCTASSSPRRHGATTAIRR